MMRSTTVLALLAAALPLAACGSSNEGGANTTQAAPANASTAAAMGAKVRDLPEGQRNGVLFRAIRDSGSTGQSCQAVTSMREVAAVNGAPAWVAVCDNNAQWTIVFTADGGATVTGPFPLDKKG
ncbi:hypothetical protein RN629_11310 [Sphingomonadaceae bacterium jetA1]|jgi:hypothetical protein|uniref:hypothetical protein n=1 Tax=Facivitalis istanbulensis TaxID=3075838 RepID=UPI0034947AF6